MRAKASIPYGGSIFQKAKEIPIIEVARRYLPGELRQRGTRWISPCPFHNEKKPSFYLFPDGFKCFGCGEYGDAVDLVAKIYSLRPVDAARLITRDFGIQVDKQPQSSATIRKAEEVAYDRQLVTAFREWRDREYFNLCTVYRAIGHVLAHGSWNSKIKVMHFEPYLEHLLDILLYGPIELQTQLYRSRHLEDIL